jgi:hypothetical protein
MEVWLVIVDGDKDKFRPYGDRYRVFTDDDKMLTWAKENGYENNFIGISRIVGVQSQHWCGDTRVSIMRCVVDWEMPARPPAF